MNYRQLDFCIAFENDFTYIKPLSTEQQTLNPFLSPFMKKEEQNKYKGEYKR